MGVWRVTIQSQLKLKWSKKEQDIVIEYPRKCDGNLVHYYLCCENINYRGGNLPSFLQELEERGYDLTTIKFSIGRKH